MNTPDESLAALLLLLSVVLTVALYVWTALAVSAMFRKMGEEPWKAWVPFLNTATLLQWGGFNPWLVLLSLVPVAQIVVYVLVVISAHRINPGFGYGNGMTVLAALLFVVWASILGFGPARWLGARAAGRRGGASAGSGSLPAGPAGAVAGARAAGAVAGAAAAPAASVAPDREPEHFSSLLVDILTGDESEIHERLADDIRDAFLRIESRGWILEDHLDGAAALTECFALQIRHVFPFKVHLSRIGLVDVRQYAGKRRLAASGFTNEAEGFSFMDRDRHMVSRLDGNAVFRMEGEAYVLRSQQFFSIKSHDNTPPGSGTAARSSLVYGSFG